MAVMEAAAPLAATEAAGEVTVVVEGEATEPQLVWWKSTRRISHIGFVQGTDRVNSNPNAQDLNVAKVEDALHPATKKMLDLGGLKLTEDNPTRPGYGTRGAAIVLTANYIELLPPSTMVLHRYDMDITPEVNGRKHHRVVQLLLQSPELAAHQGSLATDFQRTIVTKTKFKHDEDIIEVLYRSEGEDEPAIGATVYKIRVQYTKTLSVGALIDWINSTSLGKTFDDKPELTQALNIFLNHFAKSTNNLVTIGKSKAFSLNQDAGRGDLGAGLEVIRGFFSSVRIATTRILVNVNVSHGAFYHAGPLPSLMYSYGVRSTVALERFLRLVRVQTTHLKEKRNKANQVIPRIKIVYSLARKDDGHSMAHPPRVKQHGAGAKDVEFWLEEGAISSGATASSTAVPSAAGKGKGKGKVPPKSLATSGSGKYISVFDFFKSGMFIPHEFLHETTI
jgi:eukaryotic translation initiation factor 2C